MAACKSSGETSRVGQASGQGDVSLGQPVVKVPEEALLQAFVPIPEVVEFVGIRGQVEQFAVGFPTSMPCVRGQLVIGGDQRAQTQSKVVFIVLLSIYTFYSKFSKYQNGGRRLVFYAVKGTDAITAAA